MTGKPHSAWMREALTVNNRHIGFTPKLRKRFQYNGLLRNDNKPGTYGKRTSEIASCVSTISRSGSRRTTTPA